MQESNAAVLEAVKLELLHLAGLLASEHTPRWEKKIEKTAQ